MNDLHALSEALTARGIAHGVQGWPMPHLVTYQYADIVEIIDGEWSYNGRLYECDAFRLALHIALDESNRELDALRKEQRNGT